jgi:hypothetical protein
MAVDTHLTVVAKSFPYHPGITQGRDGDSLGVRTHRIIHGGAQDELRYRMVRVRGGNVNDAGKHNDCTGNEPNHHQPEKSFNAIHIHP